MTNAAALHYRKVDDRRVLAVDGPDAADFLQGLLTNDVSKAAPDVAIYAALLTPQGKFLAEMIVTRPAPTRFLLDLDAVTAAGVMQRLGMVFEERREFHGLDTVFYALTSSDFAAA